MKSEHRNERQKEGRKKRNSEKKERIKVKDMHYQRSERGRSSEQAKRVPLAAELERIANSKAIHLPSKTLIAGTLVSRTLFLCLLSLLRKE